MPQNDIFGEVISVYTRAQAIEDGVLVQIPAELQRNAGYLHPIAFTQALWAEIERGLARSGQDVSGRIWDVLWMSRRIASGVAKLISDSRVEFRVKIGARVHKLWLDIGPGDNAEPVITVGFPEDF